VSDCYAKLIAIDEEPDHEIVHGHRLGKANRMAHEPLDPGPQIDMFALDGLRVLFLDHMMLRGDVPLVGTPPISIEATDPKGRKEGLQLQKHLILPSPKDVCQDGTTVVINGMPQPPWLGFLPYVTPYLIGF
jgi:hypothetical protein